MSEQVDFDLETPLLLMAMPQVRDPFFQRSVILLISHATGEGPEENGSVGFIVNRPTDMPISEILDGLEIAWEGDGKQPAFFGGPVRPQLGTVIYRTDVLQPEGDEAPREIFPGIAISQRIGDLETLATQPPEMFRLLLGYAGWGDGQLAQEILRNDWLTAPVKDELIFARDPEATWQAALKSVGIDPLQLPSWTQDGQDTH